MEKFLANFLFIYHYSMNFMQNAYRKFLDVSKPKNFFDIKDLLTRKLVCGLICTRKVSSHWLVRSWSWGTTLLKGLLSLGSSSHSAHYSPASHTVSHLNYLFVNRVNMYQQKLTLQAIETWLLFFGKTDLIACPNVWSKNDFV